jgi:uncharacterized surface protein with fasciclin (FAS1) repeats
MLNKKVLLIGVTGALVLAACAVPAAPMPTAVPTPTEAPTPIAAPAMEAKDIVDTAVAAGSFNTLAAALTAAGLVDTLKGEGSFTVFAPTDEAFAKLDKALLEDLLKPENKDKLVAKSLPPTWSSLPAPRPFRARRSPSRPTLAG